MSANEISVNRDRENNVMYVIKNNVNPDDTSNVELKSGVIFRIDKAKKIVGFIIEDFSGTMDKLNDFNDYQLMEFFETLLEMLNDWNLARAR